MKDVQKPDHVSLNNLVNRLREGRYVIPDFQREFEWKPGDIRDLMRSIFLDYYIGSLLLWKGKPENFKALACEPLYGFNGKSDPTHIVLDGQQRLTAMYYAFMAPDMPAPGRQNRFLFFIRVDKFMDEIYDEAFEYDWTRRGINLLDNKEDQYQSHMFPLAVIGQSGWALPNWVQGYEKYWRRKADEAKSRGNDRECNTAERHAENAVRFGDHLKSITEEYQIAYIELDVELGLDKVCDIFTQINSRGVRLDVFDLINALLKPKGLQLKHMWRAAEERLSFVETERMNVYVLQVMSVLKQAYCSPKYLYYLLPGQERKVRMSDGSLRTEILIRDENEFKNLWQEAVDALEQSIKLLSNPREYGAILARYLPYVSILPAFAAIWKTARSLPPNQQLEANRKLRLWYWASVFTNRYSGSVESTTARDYLDLKKWFENDSDEPSLIGEFRDRFRSLDLRRETKRGTSVYNGIINLLIMHGAKDWITGDTPQFDDLDDHHIVPKSWAKEHDLQTSIDTILNRSPLSINTNRQVIRDRLPNVYLPELIKQNGEDRVRSILESHFISSAAFDILLRDPFEPNDFEEFIAERQRTLKDGIENLLIKERLDLSPPLRDLDAQIESVELKLRKLIVETFDGDINKLPPHILRKIRDRVQVAIRKNAALDVDELNKIERMIEYSDLRELQDVFTNKTLWPCFENYFVNKETLIKHFDQLAELRNAIRHSRTVNDVVRKEGEAALLWFQKVLKKSELND
ncbi:MAG: DUF262 domain-containing protein [Methanobacteriota archaeon]|nr:MAG: DUF262 domain-containing protein [Euryarchaeota archaeon]